MELSCFNPDFWCGRKVLVTGHTGFKGSWLTLLLLELGAEVFGFSLPPEQTCVNVEPLFSSLSLKECLGKRHVIGDIRSVNDVQSVVKFANPDVVIHMAAQSLVRRGYNEPIVTWDTNVRGTLCLLEALRCIDHFCAVVLVTTDKVYSNREWEWGYREGDRLGGHDPYSASKAAAELLASSWRSSFCGSEPQQTPHLAIATARAGNVIGGGDWSYDRIVPDAINALSNGKSIAVRNPDATRPWQHVLEPLSGYLKLAECLTLLPTKHSCAYNFGPTSESNRTVRDLVACILSEWPGNSGWHDSSMQVSLHEAQFLHLVADRARCYLNWAPKWDFHQTVKYTVNWYKLFHKGNPALSCCLSDLMSFASSPNVG